MRKSEVQMHSDRMGGYCPNPAVNIKVYQMGCTMQDVMGKFGCSEKQAAKALEFALEAAQCGFWEYWQDDSKGMANGMNGEPEAEYRFFPNHDVSVHCEGRSGGWLVVIGLPELDEWDAVMVARWAKFQKHVKQDVEYRVGKDAMLEDIETNEWWKEHSSQYNMCSTPKGDFCVADVKADVAAYATEKYGFVPALP